MRQAELVALRRVDAFAVDPLLRFGDGVKTDPRADPARSGVENQPHDSGRASLELKEVVPSAHRAERAEHTFHPGPGPAARRHGIAPVHRSRPAYPYMREGDGEGVVCE